MADNKVVQRTVKFRNHHYLADTTGTGWWRHMFPINTMYCVQDQIGMQNTYSRLVNPDPRAYVGVNSVWIQRWITPDYRKLVRDFFHPLFKKTGTKLIYEIDDLTDVKYIPLYNSGRPAFDSDEVQNSIKEMLQLSDYVVVTTNKLKQKLSECYDVPTDKIVAIPNLLPHWWIGDRYDPERKVQQFNANKSKPRIGVISSMSHYNYTGVVGSDGKLVEDDLDVILDLVRSTVNDFQWIVLGGKIPLKIQDLVSSGKVQAFPNCPLLEYPTFIHGLHLQAVVAPLQDNEFNHCKSIIKYQECAALGIPLYASKMLPYVEVMPEDQLFSDSNELKSQLMKLKFGSAGAYKKRISAQMNWLNSPASYGDANLSSWWLETNINVWTPMHTIPIEDTLLLGDKGHEDEKDRQAGTGKGSDGLEVQEQTKREVGADAT